MKERNHISLPEMVGQIVTINPQKLVNRGLLYTTQNWIDLNKLNSLFKEELSLLPPPSGWIKIHEKKGLIYIIGDGNHRIGIACVRGEEINFHIQGIWTSGKMIGFNAIIQKIQSELGGNSNIY